MIDVEPLRQISSVEIQLGFIVVVEAPLELVGHEETVCFKDGVDPY